MRPTLAKEMVRDRTAYKVGRSIVDGLLIGQLAVAALAVVGAFVYESRRDAADIYIVGGVICAAFLFAVEAVLQREVLQAIFDIADRALIGDTDPLAGGNPFKGR